MNLYEKTIQRIDLSKADRRALDSDLTVNNRTILEELRPGDIIFPTVWFLRTCEFAASKELQQIIENGFEFFEFRERYDPEARFHLGQYIGADVKQLYFKVNDKEFMYSMTSKYSLSMMFWKATRNGVELFTK